MIPAPVLLLLKSKLFWQVAAIVTLVLAVIAAVMYRDAGIRKEEAAKWKVEIAKCQDNLKTAVDANKSLQEASDKLSLQVRQQNEKIKSLMVQEAAARKVRDEALARAYARERELREEMVRLTAIASGPPAPNKEVACETAYSVLRDYAGGVR